MLARINVMTSKILKRSIAWGGLVAIGLWGNGVAAAPSGSQSQSQPPALTQEELSNLDNRLAETFSPEIRSTLSACLTAGGVNLAASASSGNSLTCGDGSTVDVAYDRYLDAVSNFFAGSFLLGMSQGTASQPQVTPSMLSSFVAGEGAGMMHQSLGALLVNGGFVATDSPANPLTDAILQKAAATLNRLDSFGALLGTPEQMSFVVSNFCTPPGLSVAEAQRTVPNLSSSQLYAICLNEAGFAAAIGN